MPGCRLVGIWSKSSSSIHGLTQHSGTCFGLQQRRLGQVCSQAPLLTANLYLLGGTSILYSAGANAAALGRLAPGVWLARFKVLQMACGAERT